jgi:hypothetical protein
MAAGNRNKKGKPTDYVVHSGIDFVNTLCGINATVISSGKDSDVTCLKCLKKMARPKSLEAGNSAPNSAMLKIALCLRALVVAISDGFDDKCAEVFCKEIDAVLAQLQQ